MWVGILTETSLSVCVFLSPRLRSLSPSVCVGVSATKTAPAVITALALAALTALFA